MKGPSPCEPFGEPSAEPSPENQGSPEGSHENQGSHEHSDEPFYSHEGRGEYNTSVRHFGGLCFKSFEEIIYFFQVFPEIFPEKP